MDALNVTRPAAQAGWGTDGRSLLPLLRAPVAAFDKQTQAVYAEGKNVLPVHPMGWMYDGWDSATANLGFRLGQYKYVRGSKSCGNDDCKRPMLFDLAADLGEHTDLSKTMPDVFAAIQANFSAWYASVLHSIVNESQCQHIGPPTPKPPTPAPVPTPPPAPGPPSSECEFDQDMALVAGTEIAHPATKSKEDCCGYCMRDAACAGAAYHASGPHSGECVLREHPLKKKKQAGAVVCVKKA
jgi:hypothetical protein